MPHAAPVWVYWPTRGRAWPSGHAQPGLGIILVVAAGALLVPMTVGATGKPLVAVVLGAAAARFALSGDYELTGSLAWQHSSGAAGVVVAGLACYATMAFELDSARAGRCCPSADGPCPRPSPTRPLISRARLAYGQNSSSEPVDRTRLETRAGRRHSRHGHDHSLCTDQRTTVTLTLLPTTKWPGEAWTAQVALVPTSASREPARLPRSPGPALLRRLACVPLGRTGLC